MFFIILLAITVVILEYACPVWHNSLTNEQCHQIESIQRRALKIICGQYTTYNEICSNLKLSSLADRRSVLCKAKFTPTCTHSSSYEWSAATDGDQMLDGMVVWTYRAQWRSQKFFTGGA